LWGSDCKAVGVEVLVGGILSVEVADFAAMIVVLEIIVGLTEVFGRHDANKPINPKNMTDFLI